MIGVVAGVGPYAGLDLLRKILDQTRAERDQDHLTVYSISSPVQIPDRSDYLLGRSKINPAPAILQQLLLLEKMGAQVVGIPCNTAHAPAIFSPIIKGLAGADSEINLLHMIDEVGKELRRNFPEIRKVGLLSTTGTAETRVYPLTLDPFIFDILTPAQTLQAERIHPAIYDPDYGLKAQGQATERAREDLMLGLRHLQEAGAEAIILGCTEIPLAFPEKEIDSIPLIDPTLILARALISAIDPTKLKN